MNCSLLVDESCPGLWKRRLKLKKYPRFWQKKTFKVAIACYENLAMFQLIRGFSDVALSVLKMMQKVIEQNDPTWVAELSNEIRRQNGLFSLAYLGCGDASKAALHLMKAISSADGDIDAYTCACIQYVQSFHSASNGLFSAAFDQCMDSANSLCQVKELGMQHLVYLSAGWYAFLLGDVNRSTELYHTVFEYGLSTADRPLIKMSLELYAAILIMNEDFPNANLVLDNLKSPLQTSATSDGWIRPSSIKSSLIAISCALEKRFSYAIPHIQFACNVLSEINPSNPVCGIYLFFSAFSAIEVLLNIDLLPLELRKSTASALMPAASRSVHALERCMCSAPTLKLMHLACLMKLQRLEVSPNISVLSEGIKLSKSLDSDDRYSSGVHLNVDIKLKDSESNFNSSRREKCALLLKYQDKWVNIGNVGVHDEFTLGKLFYHKERMALCQQLNLTDEFIKSTFDSGFFYKQLIKLYSRDTSLRALSEKLDSARSILNIDSARRDISRLNQSTECVSGIRSNSLYDMELSPDVQDKYVTEQLVKLHLYEQLRQKSDAEERKHEMHAGLKQNTNLSGPSLRLGDNKSTKMTSNRFSPITRRPKVSPEWVSDDSPLMSISPTKIPAFASARRGSV